MAIALTLFGIASIAYGVAVMSLNSGTPFFAVWYAIGAAFLVAALTVHAGAWDAAPAIAKGICGAIAAALCATLVITGGLMASQFGAQGERGLDCIIVLGAQVRADGSPTYVLQYRLDAAAAYLRDNPRTACIVSGGQGPNEPCAEADCMAAYLQRRGVDASRIVREDKSTNTVQNIANSMAILGPDAGSVGIVTNDFHVFRAVTIARKAGLRDACGIAAYSTPLYLPNNMLRESMGIVKDFLAGNL